MPRRKKRQKPAPLPTPGRGTVDQFEELHGLVTRVLARMVRDEYDQRGYVRPAVLSVVIRFLLMNGIDSPERNAAAVADLLAELPDLDAIMARVPNAPEELPPWIT